MDIGTPSRHLMDGELLELLDAGTNDPDIDPRTGHMLECGACAGRMDTLRFASERARPAISEIQLPRGFPSVGEAMRRAETAGRKVGRGSPDVTPKWLRAAAVIFALLLPLALIGPVRAAVTEWVRQGWMEMVGRDTVSPRPSASESGRAEPPAGYTVWFTPGEARFEIVIETRQAGGQLLLGLATGTEGSLTIEDGDSEAALLTDTGLVIRNDVSSETNYRVELPARVEHVRVRMASEDPITVERAAYAEGWRADLSR